MSATHTRTSTVRRRAILLGALGRVVALSAIVAGFLASSGTSALAVSQRGHAFAFAFGSKGAGEGQFLGPSGVAVDDLTDEVYVSDGPDNRVERFQCTVSEGMQACTFLSEFKVPSPQEIAVDNSTGPSSGDVYVVSGKPEKEAVYKLTRGGETIAVMKGAKEGSTEVESFEELHGVAVDASGRVWVYHEEMITSLTHAEKNQFSSSFAAELPCARPGLAVSGGGDEFYVLHEDPNSEEECPRELGEEPRAVVAQELSGAGERIGTGLSGEGTTAVAVERNRGTAYLDNESTIAALSPGPVRALMQRFGSGHLSGGVGIAVDASEEVVYVADTKADQVAVFTPEPPGAPSVDSVDSQNITPTSTRLEAQINPNGAETTYTFQYGTVDCRSKPSACGEVPVPPGKISGGFVDQGVSVQLMNLQPATTYYYRVLATNLADGHALTTEAAQSLNTFTTLPTAVGVLPDSRAWEMVSPPEKDGSGIEPIRREGGLIQASEDGSAISYLANGPTEAEAEGNRAPEPTQVLSTRNPGGWNSKDIVTPHAKGEGLVTGEAPEYRFFSPDLSRALVQPQLNRVEPLEQPLLSPEAREKTMYVRNNSTCEAEPGTCYQPLVTGADDTANTEFGGHLEFLGASPDLSHVVFQSDVALTAGPSEPGLYEWESAGPLRLVSVLPGGASAPAPNLGTYSQNGTPNVRHAISADGSRVIWSNEEETESEETRVDLYMRETGRGETVKLNAAAPGVSEPTGAESDVHFQSASSDGSRVFFTDTARLTSESTLQPLPGLEAENPADLYECEMVEVGEKLACDLKDLTVDGHPGEGAGVRNVVLGAGEDGSTVYFVANGVLAPGATPGSCLDTLTSTGGSRTPPPEATCNLYVYERDREHPGQYTTRFIAALSGEDEPDWGSSRGPESDLSYVTSRVSPNGRYLAFMSDRSLTGYDNFDANSGEADEEVYLYDASSERLVCASCNPSGAPPTGVFDTQHSGEGLGLLVDRPEIWKGRWLAGSVPGWTTLDVGRGLYQSRYLSNDGRLYFDSPDALVSQDHNAKEDVYQYEPSGEGDCVRASGCVGLISSGDSPQESAFLDASTSANDAFLLTAQQMVAQDHDGNYDVYDARVCTDASPCLNPPPPPAPACDETSANPCRPAPSSQPPPGGSSGTAAFTGPGNIVHSQSDDEAPSFKRTKAKQLTPKQKLILGLKTCRKVYKKDKHKRAACESHVRKEGKARQARKSRTRSTGRKT